MFSPLFTPKFHYAAIKWSARLDEAVESFSKAAWSMSWRAPASYQLAEIAAMRGNLATAETYLDQSLAVSARNPQAMSFKSALLRRQGKVAEAGRYAEQITTIDPLDIQGKLEAGWAKSQSDGRWEPYGPYSIALSGQDKNTFSQLPHGIIMELYLSYLRSGLSGEANLIVNNCRSFPLLDVILPAWPAPKTGLPNPAGWLGFPFQHECIQQLESAGNWDNVSPLPWYYLGCLLYDNQPARAIGAWEKSLAASNRLGEPRDQFLLSLIHRNLGQAYAQHQKDTSKAIASLEKAVQLDPKEPRFLFELDVQNEAGGTAVKRRLQWLTTTLGVAAQRDDSLTRLIHVYLADNQLDKALEILTTHRFHNWEGSSDIRNVYVDARLIRGQQHLRAKRTAEALKDFEAALEFPANLEVGRPKRDGKAAQIAYHIALAHAALGNADKAKEFFTQASAGRGGGGGGASEASYFRALAMQKAGRADDAKATFENLVKQGQELQTSEPADYFAKFGEKRAERVRKADAHYLTGVGYLGLGKKTDADAEFKKALDLHPAHLGCISHQLQ